MLSQAKRTLLECEDILIELKEYQNLLQLYFSLIDSESEDDQKTRELLIEIYQRDTTDRLERLTKLVKAGRKAIASS